MALEQREICRPSGRWIDGGIVAVAFDHSIWKGLCVPKLNGGSHWAWEELKKPVWSEHREQGHLNRNFEG